jgi:hypothetical protein
MPAAVMTRARIFILPPQLLQSSTSMRKVRFRSSAQGR